MIRHPAFRRGDIVMVDLPYVTNPQRSKVRPAVIVQNDVGNRFSPHLIVAAISSQPPRRPYPTALILRGGSPEAAGTGLDRDSVVHGELILTIPKGRVVQRLGRLGTDALPVLDRCLKVSLAME